MVMETFARSFAAKFKKGNTKIPAMEKHMPKVVRSFLRMMRLSSIKFQRDPLKDVLASEKS